MIYSFTPATLLNDILEVDVFRHSWACRPRAAQRELRAMKLLVPYSVCTVRLTQTDSRVRH